MRRVLAAALLLSACVSVAPQADPRGAVAPGQRLVVAVYPAPGPWIVSGADSKAESAAKVLPLGFIVQTMQDDRINDASKELQPYLPRPRYERALEAAVLKELRLLHGGKVQSWAEAELPAEARREFNRAEDALDWKRKYFAPESGSAPRDYPRFLSLDDAVVVDVNLLYGTDVTEEGALLPSLTAATRVIRPSTGKVLWSRVDQATDRSSTKTLPEFRAEPKDLTDRLEKLVPELAKLVADGLAKDLLLQPPAPEPSPPAEPVAAPAAPPAETINLPGLSAADPAIAASSTSLTIESSSASAPSPAAEPAVESSSAPAASPAPEPSPAVESSSAPTPSPVAEPAPSPSEPAVAPSTSTP